MATNKEVTLTANNPVKRVSYEVESYMNENAPDCRVPYTMIRTLIESVPAPKANRTAMFTWLNSVLQKSLTYEKCYTLVLAHSYIPTTLLHVVQIRLNDWIIASAYGTSLANAKYVCALDLLSLFMRVDEKTTQNLKGQSPVQELAGDSGAIAAPLPDQEGAPLEKYEDTTVLALTNPQSSMANNLRPFSKQMFQEFSKSLPNLEYPAMQHREHYFGEFTMKTTDTSALPIKFIDIPQALLNVQGSVGATPFINHVYNAVAVEIILKVNPAPNQHGLYLASHIPTPNLVRNSIRQVWSQPMQIFQRSGIGCAQLNLGTQNDLRYTVPFNCPANFIAIEETEDPLSNMRNSAEFFIVPVVPLATGDSDIQTLTGSIWYRFIEAELNAMRYDKTVTSEIRGTMQELSGNAAMGKVWGAIESLPIVGSLANTIGNVLGESAASINELVGGPSNFRENLEEIGMISGTGKDKGGGESILTGLLRSSTDVGNKLTPYSNRCMSHAGSDLMAHRIALSDNPGCLQDSGQLDFSWWMTRDNLLQVIPINTSMAKGTILVKLTMGMLNKPEVYSQVSSGTRVLRQTGTLGVVASTMQFYCGKKVYKFMIVKTAFHKLSLAVAGTPGAEVPDNVEAGSQYFKVLDFNESMIGSYDCPYVEKFGARTSPLSDTKLTTATPQPGFVDTVPFPGEIAVILTNPLVVTGNAESPIVSDTVSLLIWESMDTASQVYCPIAPMLDCYYGLDVNPPSEGDLMQFSTLKQESRCTGCMNPDDWTADDMYYQSGDFRGFPKSSKQLLRHSCGRLNSPTPAQELAGDGYSPVMTLPGSLVQDLTPKEPRTFGTFASALPQIQMGEAHTNIYSILKRYTTPIALDGSAKIFSVTPRVAVDLLGVDPTTRAGPTSMLWMYCSAFQWWTGGMDCIVTDESAGDLNFLIYEPVRYVTRGDYRAEHIKYQGILGSLAGNMYTMFSPSVNRVFSASVSSFIKSNRMSMHQDFTVVNQQRFPDDACTGAAGNLILTKVDGINGPKGLLFLKPSGDFRVHGFMGTMPLVYESNNVAPPMIRELVTDEGSREMRTFGTKEILQSANSKNVQIAFRYRDTPTSRIPVLPAPIVIKKADPIPPPELNSAEESRLDGNIRLLASGIESNPGPVFSKVSSFSQSVFSGISNSTKKVSSTLLEPVTTPINGIRDDVHVVSESLVDTSAAVHESANNISSLTSKLSGIVESVETVAKDLMRTIMETVKVPNFMALWQAVLHFVHMWASPTKTTLGISILGIFSALELVPAAMMATGCLIFGKFKSYWSSSPESNSEGENQELSADVIEDAWTDMVSFAISCVSHLIGYKMTAKEPASLTAGMILKFPQMCTMTTHVTRFLKNTLELFKRAFRYITSKMPGGGAARFLTSNTELVETFVSEANELVNPLNAEALKNQPVYKQRFWTCVMIAYYLRGASATDSNFKLPQALHQIIKEVLRKADEFSIQYQCCPVRYEPFVACFAGASSIGKSYLSTSVITELLQQTGYKGYDTPIYVRTPGNQYWNGCTAQPAVMYDDFLAVKGPDFSNIQLSEFFSLKTTANFNPPMADISDKRLRYNPLLVWLNCNNPFPQLNGVGSPEAIYRRRDVLISVRVRKEFESKSGVFDVNTVDEEIRKKFGHLEFGFYARADQQTPPSVYIGYEEFRVKLKEIHLKYHETEKKHVQYRLDSLQKLMPEQAARIPTGVDPFTLFYEAQVQAAEQSPTQTGTLPSELARDVILAMESRGLGKQLLDAFRKIRGHVSQPKSETESQEALIISMDEEPEAGSSQEMAADEVETAEYEHDRLTAPPMNPPIADSLLAANQPFRDASQQRFMHSTLGMFEFSASCINWCSEKTMRPVNKWAINKYVQFLGHNYTNISHVIECCVCRARKPCSYRCSQEVVHPVCAECAGIMMADNDDAPVNCPVCRTSALQKWRVRTESPLADKVKCLFLSALIHGTSKFQSFINWVSSHGYVIDIMVLVSVLLLSVGVPLYDSYQTSCVLQEYLDVLNQQYDGDYQLTSQYAGGVKHYWAVSRASPMDRFMLAGDEVEEEFVDASSDDTITAIQYEDGVKCYVSCKIRPVELATMEHQPVTCPHSFVQRSWEYVQCGSVGAWIDPRDRDRVAPDAYCPQNCAWDSEVRTSFLKVWGPLRYREIYSFTRPNANQRGFQTARELPPDFILLDQPVIQPRKKETWLAKWVEKLQITQWWEWISETVRAYGKMILAASAVLGIILGATSLFSFLSPTTPTQSGYTTGRSIAVSARAHAQTAHVQQLSGNHEFDNKIRLIYNNLIWFSVTEGPGKYYCAQAIAIRGQWVMLTKHQYRHLIDAELGGKPITMASTREKKARVITFVGCNVMEYAKYDLVSVQLSPSAIGPYKSIIPFAYSNDIVVQKVQATTLHSSPHSDFMCATSSVVIKAVGQGMTARDPDQDKMIEFHNVIETSGYSGKNICGTLLLTTDNNNPLCGFYFSSDKSRTNGLAFAIPLNKHILTDLSPEKLKDVEDLRPSVSEIPLAEQKLAGDYRCVGSIARTRVPFQNSKSKIFPSVVSTRMTQAKVPSSTEPCCLSASDPRWKHAQSPLLSGCENLCQPKKDFPVKLEDKVVAAALTNTLQLAKPLLVTVGKRSIAEAVCGLDHHQYPAIKMDTSVGWPFNLLKNEKNQMLKRPDIFHPILDDQDKMISVEPEKWFLDQLEESELARQNGISQPTVFWDHLKDERRKSEKLRRPGGTRIFSLSPIDFLVQYRQYNMDFVAAWTDAWTELEHAVGISADGPDWTTLACRLLAKGNNIVCLDYSNFGPGLNIRLAGKLDRINQMWYIQHTSKERRNNLVAENTFRGVMTHEIVSPLHLCTDMVYQTLSGIPSGHPGTTPLNTEVNKAYIKMCWLALAPKPVAGLDHFREHVALFCYGDDLIMSVDDCCIDWFNAITIMKWFERFDVKVTPASKTGTLQKCMRLTEAQFLKRSFVPHPNRLGLYLAPLEWSSVVDCAHWIQGDKNNVEATQINLEQSLRLAYGHGKKAFDDWKKFLNDVSFGIEGLQPLLLDWDHLDSQFFE